MLRETNESNRHSRESLKTHRRDWKNQLRENCLRRIREERAHLLWKIRSNDKQSADQKQMAESACREIVSDELRKIKLPPFNETKGTSVLENDDLLWEYNGITADNSIEIESEDILIEMERLLYEELRQEKMRREIDALEDEDEFLARAVFEHMRLDNNQQRIWCPVCIKGELREAYHLIYCTACKLRLDLENDKVNLNFLKDRLAEVHEEHFERGCKAPPKFLPKSMFGLTATYLYIQCEICGTCEIVI